MLDSRISEHAAMRITFVVPGLLALPHTQLSQHPILARLAARAAQPRVEADLDSALLGTLGIDAAPAPLAALGAGLDVARAWTIRADPVSMIVGREDAHIEQAVFDLDDSERHALLATMNAHFAADGLAFAAPRTDAWFATLAVPSLVATSPLEAASGRALRAFLPSGADAARWRRWLTEAQMLLHEHALAQRAGAPVNSLWFHGGGTLPARESMPGIAVHAHGGRAADVVRGIAVLRGEAAGPVDSIDAVLRQRVDAIVALAPLTSDEALEAMANRWLAPALDRLDASALSSIGLIAGSARLAASWEARPHGWFARWKQRHVRFSVPERGS